MTDRYLLIERCQTGRKCRGRIPLNQNNLGRKILKIVPQALQRSAGDVGQCLAWCHQVEILVGLQTEEIHHLGHHFPVLTGQHNPGR